MRVISKAAGSIFCLLTAMFLGAPAVSAATITVATVNNDDMIIMKRLSTQWEKETGNTINWVVLEENVLRQRVTTDIATKGGEFDVITIGAYETPIWGKLGWLAPLDGFDKSYDYADLFPSLRNGLSVNGKLYAAPFYAESSFTLYRSDLFKQAGLVMPEKPTWDQIASFADKLTDRSKGEYGICLRGKPGWGESMGLITTMANTFGGSWFNMAWQPQLTSAPWEKAVQFYVDLLRHDGPPGATTHGFNENQALFATGKCAIWVDATSAAGRLYNKETSKVGDVLAFAQAPPGSGPGRSPFRRRRINCPRPSPSSSGPRPETMSTWSETRRAGWRLLRGHANRPTPIPTTRRRRRSQAWCCKRFCPRTRLILRRIRFPIPGSNSLPFPNSRRSERQSARISRRRSRGRRLLRKHSRLLRPRPWRRCSRPVICGSGGPQAGQRLGCPAEATDERRGA
jgi:hypothetical protein